ncbi:ChaB family protein [Methanoculleus sp.]|uniref:ChaB family protein n=1 Tax=Methanoculleus sp. TaxID=90427 RepID=UPI00344C9553
MRELLPEHGREIYREAFNSAWEQYADPSERRNPEESREEVAHKVAWAAVEQVYEKGPGASGGGRKRRSSRFCSGRNAASGCPSRRATLFILELL